ncbi:Pleiotropic drug resistance protein 2 [Morella rubra]|uniref:Pleiotropic drug resistance protein 2 n=1 Tax=Morella rubra TaxID=262757 RepID=A0A6A1WD25_9ROSI|nr:Pleiotropic drug resistance protein 2 [Morella rubra]
MDLSQSLALGPCRSLLLSPGVAPQDFKMFFKQFLAFFGIHQMALCLFRFIAALGRTEVVGNTLGTFTLLMCGVALSYEDFGN